MWLDHRRLKTIRTPRSDRDVDRVLAEGLVDRALADEIPSTCPVCHELLTVRVELGLAVRSCALGHGAWLSTADVAHLRSTAAQAIRAARRRRLGIALVTLAVVSLLASRGRIEPTLTGEFLPPAALHPNTVFDRAVVARATPGHFLQIPVTGSAIDAPEELGYAIDVARVLEDGIENRLTIDRALSRQHDDPSDAFAAFAVKQRDVLARLRTMPTPPRLAAFHQHLVTATEQQMEFYQAFADRKITEPAIDRRGMRRHRALVTTNRELVAAYAVLSKLYPALDQQTHDALYGRLAAFTIT
jgi:hypothetical protein